MQTLIFNSDLESFKDHFGNDLKILGKCFCDLTKEELIRVEFPCFDSLNFAFNLGRIIESNKILNERLSKLIS